MPHNMALARLLNLEATQIKKIVVKNRGNNVVILISREDHKQSRRKFKRLVINLPFQDSKTYMVANSVDIKEFRSDQR